MSKRILTAMVTLLFVASAGVTSAQLAYPGIDTLESDPFNGGKWSRVNTQGNADWSSAQALSGNNSIYLMRTAGGFAEDPRAWIEFSGVPQTGRVQVSWWMYATGNHGGNFTISGHFGTTTTQTGGDLALCEIAYASGPQEIFIYDGAWTGTGQLLGDHANVWTSHRVVFDQDARNFDYYFDPGTGEVALRTNNALLPGGAKLGDGSHDNFMSEPSTGGTEWYIDSVYIGPEVTPAWVPVELSDFVVE